MKVKLSKSFETSVARSERVIKVAEAFGLGLESRQFTVLDDVEIDLEKGDVVYICGQSGAGKSVLLRELSNALAENGMKVANIDGVELDEGRALIDQDRKSVV